LVVAELLGDDKILADRREQLRQRRDALSGALREHLPGWRFRLPEGGLTLWVQMPHGSATQLAAEMERHGVFVAPGPVFSVEGGADGWLRIPYAKPAEDLVQAVRQIAKVWTAHPAAGKQRRQATRLLVA